jgi:hypothetical protein
VSGDRELLERAAKAIGLKVTGAGHNLASGEHWLIVEPAGHWRPLVDDGDCFRLAIAAGVDLQRVLDDLPWPAHKLPERMADIRRAIVTSVAETWLAAGGS